MVSAEQRWNEGTRAYGRTMQALHRAGSTLNNARLKAHRNPNNARAQANLERAKANHNRARQNYRAATNQTTTAYRELLRKYHLPGLPVQFQNAVMENLVRTKKEQTRHNQRVRALSSLFPVHLANKIASHVPQ
jgi:septation ring formation regulator EzrA